MDDKLDVILLNAEADLLARLEQPNAAEVDRWFSHWSTLHSSDPTLIAHFRAFADIARKSGTANRKLVIVLHGIRDQGEWMEMVKECLQTKDVFVQPIDFEYFDSVRFMTGWGVSRTIDRVLVKIRNAKADHVGAELLVIAHSFGTYIISEIALNHTDVRFSRAIFCGSVIRRSFEFNRVPHCPKIVNECGGRDIWPVVAEGFAFWGSYGAAGVWGLRASGIEDRFHDTTHSGYLTRSFVEEFWKPYIAQSILVPSPYQATRRPTPWWLTALSHGRCYVRWILLLNLIVLCVAWWKCGLSCAACATILSAVAWVAIGICLYAAITSYANGHQLA